MGFVISLLHYSFTSLIAGVLLASAVVALAWGLLRLFRAGAGQTAPWGYAAMAAAWIVLIFQFTLLTAAWKLRGTVDDIEHEATRIVAATTVNTSTSLREVKEAMPVVSYLIDDSQLDDVPIPQLPQAIARQVNDTLWNYALRRALWSFALSAVLIFALAKATPSTGTTTLRSSSRRTPPRTDRRRAPRRVRR